MTGSSYGDKLVSALADPNPIIRRRAAWLLGWKRETAAVQPLLAAIPRNRDDPYVLAVIADALGAIGHPGARSALEALLADSYVPVRAAAARALGRIGDRCSLGSLAAALNDPNEVVRREAREALERLENPPVWRRGTESRCGKPSSQIRDCGRREGNE